MFRDLHRHRALVTAEAAAYNRITALRCPRRSGNPEGLRRVHAKYQGKLLRACRVSASRAGYVVNFGYNAFPVLYNSSDVGRHMPPQELEQYPKGMQITGWCAQLDVQGDTAGCTLACA